MAKKLKLGVIGMSEGNGHPYSWSAIFNGYNKEAMEDCPFPAIPEYLFKQSFPQDGLGTMGEVTHIWTQEKKISKHIARASKIINVVVDMEDMISEVDAILLARDDAENHYQMALPFLKAGLPIFIDKPLATSLEEARKILEAQTYQDQVYSCSSLRYAKEFNVNQQGEEEIGRILHVEGSVPKKWETYAVHIIDPIVKNLPERGKLQKVIPFKKNNIQMCLIAWENVSAYLKVTGLSPAPLELSYFGEKGYVEKPFQDSYSSFKKALEVFVKVVNKEVENIPREETLEIIEIIEKGNKC